VKYWSKITNMNLSTSI